ncbi:MAG: Fur family zinc uptake transcriptional regulator [Halocynthiibacter sp.]|jgi:Fur family zinc uptake transcriptional regulator
MPESQSPAFHSHNHASCTGDLLQRADELARLEGLRLTPVRRRALEILLEEHRALGAYDVLERLREDGFGSQPPVAYRALEFLVENGLAHRIRRLNAFMACMHPGESHAPAFFICTQCNSVAELPEEELRSAVELAAAKIGFAIERVNVEAIGVCPSCAESAG